MSKEREAVTSELPRSKPISQREAVESKIDPIFPIPRLETSTGLTIGVLPYVNPGLRPPLRPPDQVTTENRQDLRDLDTNTVVNIDFEENSPFQENIISEIYDRPDKSYFTDPTALKDLLDTTKVVQKFLPKQTDIDKILEIIKKKVLKGVHLPVTIKEIQVGYLNSPYFKDIYLYLAQNKLPSKKIAIRRVETLVEKYILLDSLLFKLVSTTDKESALLAVPEICADKIITLYHASLFAGYQGVIKTYLTISNRFFIPNLMHCL